MASLLDRNSKADTRLLSLAGSGLDSDKSQWRANLTNHTTYHTSTDTRLAVRSPRELAVVVDIATTNSRVILNWGDTSGASYIYRIEVQTGGTGIVDFGHNGALLASVTPPNVNISPRTYVLHWSTDYDVRAATYFSELAICDVASGTWVITRVTHTQPQAPAGGDQFNLGGYGAGVKVFTGGLAAIAFARVSCRFHTTTEAKEDWVAQSSAPTVAGVQLPPELAPSSTSFYTANPAEDVSDALLDAGTFAGPAELAAVINAGAGRKRLYSPMINLAPRSPDTLDDTYTPAKFFQTVNPGIQIHLGYLVARDFPYPQAAGTLSVRVRIHAQTWIAAGAPGGTAVSVDLRALQLLSFEVNSINFAALVTITDNHGSGGLGQWYDLGALPLVDFSGYFVVGYKFGAGTGHTYLRMKIKAVQFELYEET